jgi:hypothetical protein
MVSLQQRSPEATAHTPSRWAFWSQWTLANAVAEVLGLGGTLLTGMLLFARLEPLAGPVVSALLAVVIGMCLEGSIVGTAQWLVLRQALSRLAWQQWTMATAIGAGIAWTLGMIPSTIIALNSTSPDAANQPAPEPSALVYYGAAAALGFFAGSILAVAQWWVLRGYVQRAWWWLPANGCAWALGMVLIFVGTSFIPASGITLGIILLLIAFVVAAGTVVGATHGIVLVWLLREQDRLRHTLPLQAALVRSA